MTPSESLLTLAFARQADFDEDAQSVYLRLLAAVPNADLERACLAYAAQPKDPYEPAMPTAGAILARCRGYALERTVTHDAETLNPAALYRCFDCRDTGWREDRCEAGPTPRCGRLAQKGEWVTDGKQTYRAGRCVTPHTYVEPCHCLAARGHRRLAG